MLRRAQNGPGRCAGLWYSSCCHETIARIEAEMAERFFKKECQKLCLGEGQEFRGERILAATEALLAEMNLPTGGRP